MKGIASVMRRCQRYLGGLIIKDPAYSLLTLPSRNILKDFRLAIIRKTSIFVLTKYIKKK